MFNLWLQSIYFAIKTGRTWIQLKIALETKKNQRWHSLSSDLARQEMERVKTDLGKLSGRTTWNSGQNSIWEIEISQNAKRTRVRGETGLKIPTVKEKLINQQPTLPDIHPTHAALKSTSSWKPIGQRCPRWNRTVSIPNPSKYSWVKCKSIEVIALLPAQNKRGVDESEWIIGVEMQTRIKNSNRPCQLEAIQVKKR